MRTTALIVTHNRLEKLKKCWGTTSPIKFDNIIIVNNSSTDGTGLWLEQLDDDRLIIINSIENTGGAGGFKMGAEYIKAHISTDWIFIYDDDAYPDKNILDEFEKVDKTGYVALSSRVVDPAGVDCKMNMPFKTLPLTLYQNIQYMFMPERFLPESGISSDCMTLSFVGAIVRYDIFVKSIDYIHDKLFIYYDDVFYSYHLVLNGYKFKYTPNLLFTHDIPATSCSDVPPWKKYYLTRNLLLSRKLFGSSTPYSCFSIFLRLIKLSFSCLANKRKYESLCFMLEGIFDGLKGKNGKR
ncbi:MAG: glycosyltransferase [Rouxiella aceris]|uniref:glycosyltransferase n=1 Tax=Rouxiella aceris TaxID=2703884 RepID=UPI0028491C87|nr:glycosyltransferase [Rouxiella aceris]MDR3432619.1 glycosyltransferase [Rouxiella aceris]